MVLPSLQRACVVGLLLAVTVSCAGRPVGLHAGAITPHGLATEVALEPTSQGGGGAVVPASVGEQAPRGPANAPDRMTWWREARFGIFVHWGLYAIPAGAWDGASNHAEWIRTTARIPLERYDELRERWNPTKFDADSWAEAVADAGARYMVVTTKHHDGFALFDSEVSDFDVAATPSKRDIMAEIAAANARAGVVTGWYHSIMDWHHPDYLPRRDWESRDASTADFERYERYLHRQVTELLTRYGPVGVMWFDGEWEQHWNHARGRALYDLCRRLQPDVVVNNRVDVGRSGLAGLTVKGDYAGDFGTPEQEVPPTGIPGVDWESCLTMNRNWGYNAADKDFKSTRELVRTLVDVVSKGGNLLLNVGPTASGEFPPESRERLREMGAWMRVNGVAIHGTTASPVPTPEWGRVTRGPSGDTTPLYCFVFDAPADGRLRLDGIGNEVRGARVLGANDVALNARRIDRGLEVRVPVEAFATDAIGVTVIRLDLAGAPIVYADPRIEGPASAFVHATRVGFATDTDAIRVHYTLDGSEPSLDSPVARGAVPIEATTTIAARGFHEGRAVTGVVRRRLARVDPAPALDLANSSPGVVARVQSVELRSLADAEPIPSDAPTQVSETLSLPQEVRSRRNVRMSFEGYVHAPRDAMYSFVLGSDDGARLHVRDRVVCDNDGRHSYREVAGEVALAAGWHRIALEWFNAAGGSALEVRWGADGATALPIRAADLAHGGRVVVEADR